MIKEILDEWDFYYEKSGETITPVVLPHNPVNVDLNGNHHWQGLCYYRRKISSKNLPEKHIYKLYFGGAMHTAVVHIDGKFVTVHEGGYLPFEVDVTSFLSDGGEHEILVQLDNRDNSDIAPGKDLEDLDFCWYGGLYRDVELRSYSLVHITDAISADRVAGGGVFVRTLQASKESASIETKIHLKNASNTERKLQVISEILDGDCCVQIQRKNVSLVGGEDRHELFEHLLKQPQLWDLDNPQLYTYRVTLQDVASGEIWDKRDERFGIRHINMFRSGGLQLNGKRIRPRGTNRHQDHPWAGYAVPEKADRRDAVRIKSAGFDYVRLSHYPQSPAFLDACDELGILVMNCIPGWQFYGESKFQENCYDVARGLIRRDRNHPSIILWELSLNETPMPEAFMQRMKKIGHEEYPGDQMYTCGWMDAYDVFIHSRQHEQIHTWRNGDKALVVAEYGDWEYYASNEGFDQKKGLGLLDPEKNSRALRGDGERVLKQQAANFTEALADTLSCPALTCGQWGMFDYPRGYEPNRATCGVMDTYRLPKYGFYFYQSQRNAQRDADGCITDAMVFIASNWNSESSKQITVFSNCETVELYLNDELLGQMQTCNLPILPHPPYEMTLDAFVPGTLKAIGYIDGNPVAEYSVTTAGEPQKIQIGIDSQGIEIGDAPDLFFVHAKLVDAQGNLCLQMVPVDVSLIISDGLICVSPETRKTEAGIASFLLRKEKGNAGDMTINLQVDCNKKLCCSYQF
jgi:beta-galactosidase